MTTNENLPKEEEKKEALPPFLYKYRSFSRPYIDSVLDGIKNDTLNYSYSHQSFYHDEDISYPQDFTSIFGGTMLRYQLGPFNKNYHNELRWIYNSDDRGFCISYAYNNKDPKLLLNQSVYNYYLQCRDILASMQPLPDTFNLSEYDRFKSIFLSPFLHEYQSTILEEEEYSLIIYTNDTKINFELQDCGLETTAIYLGEGIVSYLTMEIADNSAKILNSIIKLLEIAQEKKLTVYLMQRDRTQFKFIPKEMNAIEINDFITKLQNKIELFEENKKLGELERKNKETLEKMQKNLQL